MKCPTCGAWSEVSETRAAPNHATRRARTCANGHRFITLEVLPQVVKAAGANAAATARAAAANAKRWARNAAIARDPRSATQVAKQHDMTEARVRQIRQQATACKAEKTPAKAKQKQHTTHF